MEHLLVDRMVMSHQSLHALISLARYQCLDKTFPFTAVRFQGKIDKYWCHFFSACVEDALLVYLPVWQG